MDISILLVDDHTIVREGIRALLEKRPDMKVLGEADNGRTAVRLARELRPDVILMDVAMPGLNGIEATRQIMNEAPDVKVLALSIHSDRRLVLGMLKAGASGYLLKDCTFAELIRAVKCVKDNQTYLSPTIAHIVVKDYLHKMSEAEFSIFSALTNREREVAQLMAEGKTTKQIASALHVSTKTVETHRQQIMKKLKIHSIAELVKLAIREGLISA
ncbi:MAG: response regulator transcription factor [Thermodesulfobacteriota bacterium]